MGRLKRIAALTASALTGVMVFAAMDVGALVGVTTPTVTVTVPQTPVTPTTTVTTPPPPPTPTVTTPAPPPAPKVDLPKVTLPKPSGGGSGSGGSSGSGSSGTGAVQKTLDSVTGGSSSGGGSGSGSGSGAGSGSGSSGISGTVDNVSGTVDKAVSGVSGGRVGSGIASGGSTSGAGATGSNTAALQALGFFGGPGSGSGGGGTGPGGQGGSGSGGNIFTSGGPGGRGGGGLPAVLSVAGAKQLRAALELLEGCMSAIAPLDRQVLLMRAGGGGAAPLSRHQVAARLGVSPRQVRFAERRGLTGLRTAASQTACAGGPGNPFSVVGIAVSPLVALTAAPATIPAVAQAAGDGDGVFVPARQAQPDGESPLAALADGGESGPAWIVVLVTVLFSVAIAGLMRELRSALGHQRPY